MTSYYLPLTGVERSLILEGQFQDLVQAARESLTRFSSTPREKERVLECATSLQALLLGNGVVRNALPEAAKNLVVGTLIGCPALHVLSGFPRESMTQLLGQMSWPPSMTERALVVRRRLCLDRLVAEKRSVLHKQSPMEWQTIQSLRMLRRMRLDMDGVKMIPERRPSDVMDLALKQIAEELLQPARFQNEETNAFVSRLRQLDDQERGSQSMDPVKRKGALDALGRARKLYQEECFRLAGSHGRMKKALSANMDFRIAELKSRLQHRQTVAPACKDAQRIEGEVTNLEYAKLRLKQDVSDH